MTQHDMRDRKVKRVFKKDEKHWRRLGDWDGTGNPETCSKTRAKANKQILKATLRNIPQNVM